MLFNLACMFHQVACGLKSITCSIKSVACSIQISKSNTTNSIEMTSTGDTVTYESIAHLLIDMKLIIHWVVFQN